MPAFFFHSDGGLEEDLDDQGTELSGVSEAREQAVTMVAQMLHNGEGVSTWNGTPPKLWVTDGPNGSGKTVFTLTVTAS